MKTKEPTNLSGNSLKLVDKFTHHSSSILSTENDVNICIANFDLSSKIKQDIFQVVSVSILLYGYTTWILTKYMKKG